MDRIQPMVHLLVQIPRQFRQIQSIAQPLGRLKNIVKPIDRDVDQINVEMPARSAKPAGRRSLRIWMTITVGCSDASSSQSTF